jgi:hypothetical protein
MLDRRSFIAAGLAGAVLYSVDAGAVAARPGVTVDVSRLRAQGLGPNASLIQTALERELAGAAAPGTELVVTVRGISMPSYSGNGGMIGSGGGDDGMDSEVTVIGPGGRVVATYPILSSSSPTLAGPWYAPGIDKLRLEAMARTNAGWIRRYVGG